MNMVILICCGGIICILCILLYWFATISYGHWKKKGVYYLEPTPFFGNVKDRFLLRKSFHDIQWSLYNEFKGHKIAGFFEGHRPVLMILDMELIKNVLIRDFEYFIDRPTLNIRREAYLNNMLINLKGQQWKNVRTILTPTFSSGKLKYMEDLVNKCGLQMEKFLTENIIENENDEFEMKEFFGRYTMDVIATCAFGVKCDSLKDPNDEFIKLAVKFNDIPLYRRILLLISILITPKLLKLFPITPFNDKSLKFLVDVVRDTKINREKNPSSRQNDFLQLMLDAAQKEHEENDQTNKKNNDLVMTDDTIVAQSLLFLLAGFETSSTLLSFASYELASHPKIQEKARDEVNDILDKYNGKVTYEALQEMNYLEMILLETLRKHPPVARIDRSCTKNYNIPGTNVTLAKNDVISVSVMGIHYDSLYYPEPHMFNPERFLPEEKNKRSQYTFLPFGAGPRNCIGLRFALMSTKIGLLYLLKEFVVKTCARSEVPIQYNKQSMLLKSNNGIWLKIEKLKKNL